MKFLQDEQLITASNGNRITLTNKRIQMKDEVLGKAYTIIIFLEDISSTEVQYKSYVILLFLGVLSVLGGLLTGSSSNNVSAMAGGIILGVIFLAIWWFTRKHIVSISSNGGSRMNFGVEGMDSSKIEEFINTLHDAKANRVQSLAK